MKILILLFVLSTMFYGLYSISLIVNTENGNQIIELNEIENMIICKLDSLVYVEGGFFIMGDHYNEGWSDELPFHDVTVDDFSISRCEITHSEFIVFLNSRGVAPNGIYNGNELIELEDIKCAIEYNGNNFVFESNNYVSSADCPVIEITWFGACEYSNWFSEINNYAPCYSIDINSVECDFSAEGYRLPTEAEWEYACRGGINWINDFRYSGCHELADLADYAWFNSSANQLNPIGEKLPNQLGVYDMSGNAYEFCWDWFSSIYYSNSPIDNPTGPETGSYHVSRGGDWNDSAQFCRSTARYSSYPNNIAGYRGFRLVRSGNRKKK